MTPDVLTRDAPAPAAQPTARGDPPAKILVFSGSLDSRENGAVPIALANALAGGGWPVMLAAAVGPLRTSLDKRVAYLVTDDAGQAPVKAAHELSRYLRHHRPDIIHSHGTRCAAVAALAVKASHAHCLRVMTHHSHGLRRLPRWLSGPIVRRCADHYVAMGGDLKADLEGLGVPGERISLEPEGSFDAGRLARDAIEIYRSLIAPHPES